MTEHNNHLFDFIAGLGHLDGLYDGDLRVRRIHIHMVKPRDKSDRRKSGKGEGVRGEKELSRGEGARNH